MHRVSVILPAYNAERHIEEAVESILSQTFDDFELIAIDDGSTDATRAILEKIARRDARVRLVSRPNKGLVATLNEGLLLSRGEYIARMDADDVSHPERLRLQVEYLDSNHDVVLLGVRTYPTRRMKWRYVGRSNPRYCSWGLTFRNKIGHPGVMFRSELIRVHGLRYREDYLYAEDFKLWCEMLDFGKAHVLPQKLLFYRQHEGSISRQNALSQLRVDRKIVSENLRRVFRVDMSDIIDAPSRIWIRAMSERVFRSPAFHALPQEDKLAIHQTYQDFCVIYGVGALMDYARVVGPARLAHSGIFLPSVIYRAAKHSVFPKPQMHLL